MTILSLIQTNKFIQDIIIDNGQIKKIILTSDIFSAKKYSSLDTFTYNIMLTTCIRKFVKREFKDIIEFKEIL